MMVTYVHFREHAPRKAVRYDDLKELKQISVLGTDGDKKYARQIARDTLSLVKTTTESVKLAAQIANSARVI